jgi:NAD(P)-dependent dehydrogenase (short-subunit alcohol dehydrogenase family)
MAEEITEASELAVSAVENFRIEGAVALVTGASSGLGHRFARVLAGAGGRLVLAARRKDRLDELAQALPDAVAVECDVSDPADRRRVIGVATEHFGRLDILVNNAGITKVQPALDESDEFFAQALDVNLVAPFALSREAARVMIDAGGGSIVNIASVAGLQGGQMPQASYHASKGGIVNLTRELAAQWGRYGVRVNALAPGWFPSEMTEPMFNNERTLEWMSQRTPLRRPGSESELDGPLLLLASQAGSFITGHTLVVDGGWTVI